MSRLKKGVFLKISVIIIVFFLAIYGCKEDVIPKKKVKKEAVLVDAKALKEYQLRQKILSKKLRKYFNSAIAAGDIVGAGIGIVQGDSILISEGFGKRSIEEKAKVDSETVFRLGSLSKGFAGVLAASLASEGKFDFNDKVTDYIPDFQLGDSLNTAKIRIAHIMSHSSGTPYHSFTNLVEDELSVTEIAKRFKEVIPQSAPGLQYSYQNAMFSLSQEVMKSVTGKDVKTLLQNRFFKPLHMNSISMDHKDLMEAKNVAMPHRRSGKSWKSLPLKNRYYNAVVAGGINANALDMAKWMRFLLGHNPKVLPQSRFKKAFEPFIQIDFNNKYYQRWKRHQQSNYGFGWRIHTLQNIDATATEIVWHHGGSVNNYRNEIAIYPEADLGICVLLNGNSRLAQTVIPDIYNLIKELDKD